MESPNSKQQQQNSDDLAAVTLLLQQADVDVATVLPILLKEVR